MKTNDFDLQLKDLVLDYLLEHKFARPAVLYSQVKELAMNEITELLESVNLPSYGDYNDMVFYMEYNVHNEVNAILNEQFGQFKYTIVITRIAPNGEKIETFGCMCDDLDVLQDEAESMQMLYSAFENCTIEKYEYDKENYALKKVEN